MSEVRLDDEEVQAAYYGLSGFIRERALAKRSVPPEVLRVRHRLDAHVRLSRARHENGCVTTTAARSEVWIGATATASMLGRGLRYVQRHADEIGGQLVGGRLLFREADVVDYITEGNCRDRRTRSRS
jgi:hypothetical protein